MVISHLCQSCAMPSRLMTNRYSGRSHVLVNIPRKMPHRLADRIPTAMPLQVRSGCSHSAAGTSVFERYRHLHRHGSHHSGAVKKTLGRESNSVSVNSAWEYHHPSGNRCRPPARHPRRVGLDRVYQDAVASQTAGETAQRHAPCCGA